MVVEFNPPTNSLGQHDEDLLHVDAGFRKKKGLRDDIDAADHLWMSIGKPQVAMPRGSSSHNIRQKDINALSQLGCDVEVLRQPGPKRDQVRRLCEVLQEGGVGAIWCNTNRKINGVDTCRASSLYCHNVFRLAIPTRFHHRSLKEWGQRNTAHRMESCLSFCWATLLGFLTRMQGKSLSLVGTPP